MFRSNHEILKESEVFRRADVFAISFFVFGIINFLDGINWNLLRANVCLLDVNLVQVSKTFART